MQARPRSDSIPGSMRLRTLIGLPSRPAAPALLASLALRSPAARVYPKARRPPQPPQRTATGLPGAASRKPRAAVLGQRPAARLLRRHSRLERGSRRARPGAHSCAAARRCNRSPPGRRPALRAGLVDGSDSAAVRRFFETLLHPLPGGQPRRQPRGHDHRLLRAAAPGQPPALGHLPLSGLRRARRPAGGGSVRAVPGAQAHAPARPARRAPRRALLPARRHRGGQGRGAGPRAAVDRRCGRAVLPADPGVRAGARSTPARRSGCPMPTRTAIPTARSGGCWWSGAS